MRDISEKAGSQAAALSSLLRMMGRDTSRTLAAEVQSPFAKHTAMTLTLMLEQLGFYMTGEIDEEVDQARADFIERLGGAAEVDFDNLRRDFDDWSGRGLILSQLLATRPPRLNSAPGTNLVAEVAAAELASLNRQRDTILAQNALDAAAMSQIEVEVTPLLLDRYFTSTTRFEGWQTRSVRQIPGGYSKDTYLIWTVDSSGADHAVVLRRDFPFGPTESSAADEFAILSRLFDAGLRVARPLAAVRDRTPLGQPFLIVERIEGQNAADSFDTDPALARSVSLQMATTLGKLHALNPDTLGLAVQDSAGEQIRRNLAQWKSFWKRHRLTGSPMGEVAFAWLDSHTPDDVSRLVAVHGDARQHNVMIKDGKITALLDWEFVHAGDPSEDLEYTRMYVEPYVGWDEFLEAYLAAGGAQTSASGSRYYEVFRALRNFICCDVGWHGFASGKYPVNKLAVQGLVYRRDFLRSLGEALLRVT